MRRQPGALGTLANGMASRALWKGDAFWDEYLMRFLTTNRGHSTFFTWLTDPSPGGAALHAEALTREVKIDDAFR